MEDDIRSIAQENITNRRKGGVAAISMLVFALVFFVICAETQFQNVLPIIGLILSLLIGFPIIIYYDRKIIGKKTALDKEIERLNALHPEEKLELPKLDDEEGELKLREMIRRNNRDDMV